MGIYAGAQDPHDSVDRIEPALKVRIDRIAEQVIALRGAPSASIAVVEGGKLVYTHAYGLAHVEPPIAATPAMRYSIGSIS
jgi:CubicO group peptidase (beta-lactamase class C family)